MHRSTGQARQGSETSCSQVHLVSVAIPIGLFAQWQVLARLVGKDSLVQSVSIRIAKSIANLMEIAVDCRQCQAT